MKRSNCTDNNTIPAYELLPEIRKTNGNPCLITNRSPTDPLNRRKRPLFFRVLVWIYLLCDALGIAGCSIAVDKREWPLSRMVSILGALGGLLTIPLFFCIAVKGCIQGS